MRRSRSIARILSLLLTAALLPPLAIADSDSLSRAIPRDAARYKGWKVGSLKIEGVSSLVSSALVKGLALANGDKEFFPTVLVEDLDRAYLYLSQRGYARAEIEVTLRPQRRGKKLDVVLHVKADVVSVDSLRYEGFPEGVELPKRSLELQLVDRALGDEAVESARKTLLETLRSAGYAKGKVTVAIEPRHASGALVRFLATPGKVYYFGSVVVEGVADDLVPLAREVVDIRAGEKYSPKKMDDAQKNLRLLGLFRRIRVTTVDVGADTLGVQAELAERKPRSVEAGIGYWNDVGLQGGASWRHRNLLKAGRGFETAAVASRFEQAALVGVRWPASFGPTVWTELRADLDRTSEDNYSQTDAGVSITNRYYLASTTHVAIGIGASRAVVTSKVEDETVVDSDERIISTWTGFLHNGADDLLRPTGGRKLNARVEWAPAKISGSEFVLGEVEGVLYSSILPGTVVTSRLRVGLAETLGDTESLLPNQRFFSGGASSHRGFARRQLGPLDSEENPLGGEALLNASLDLRVPIWRFLKGAVFADAGQLWGTVEEMQLGEFEVAIGPGLWLDTPIGPIRYDVGFRVTDLSPQPRTVHHFAIGVPF